MVLQFCQNPLTFIFKPYWFGRGGDWSSELQAKIKLDSESGHYNQGSSSQAHTGLAPRPEGGNLRISQPHSNESVTECLPSGIRLALPVSRKCVYRVKFSRIFLYRLSLLKGGTDLRLGNWTSPAYEVNWLVTHAWMRWLLLRSPLLIQKTKITVFHRIHGRILEAWSVSLHVAQRLTNDM